MSERRMGRPLIVFGRSLQGIEWNSPDGKLSHFIFLLLTSPEDDIQVQILALISRAMSDRQTRDAIMQAQGNREIWNVLEKAFAAHAIVKKGMD